jgi:hypothetical protein
LGWPNECSGLGFGIGFDRASSGSAGLVANNDDDNNNNNNYYYYYYLFIYLVLQRSTRVDIELVNRLH